MINHHDPDAAVPLSELLLSDDYEATVAKINAESARGRNPFRDIPDTRKPLRRPTPSLVIGLAMINAWCVSELARDWPAFGELSGLVLMVSFVLFVKWAKSE